MMSKKMVLILIGVASILSVASPGVAAPAHPAVATAAAGQTKGPSSEDCLGCHADKDLKKEAGGKSVSLFADEAALKGSVHGKLQCTACHTGIAEIPHAEQLAPVQCQKCHVKEAGALAESIHGSSGIDCQNCHGTHEVAPAKKLGTAPCQACHDQTVKLYLGSVHGRALASGVKEAAVCFDCHGGAHQVRAQADPDSPTSRNRMAETCGRCHADRALVERWQIPIPQAYQLYQKSVHGRAVAAGKRAATCNDCHSSHDLRRANDPRSSVYRDNVPQTCGKCHAKESKEYLGSIHGTAMRNGASDAPVCTDCHGEHLIRAARDPESSVSLARVSKTCASCHDVARINEKYGIPGGRVETYADSFHGLAVRGGSTVAANCASCHGFHDIRPSSDPKSSIFKDNLPATCGKCHPGAGENFAKGKVHVALSAREEPLLYYVRNFYLLLIAVTIAGMGLHNGLDFFKKLRREYRRRGGGAATRSAGEFNSDARGPQEWVLRMSLTERWQHGMLAVSFIVLVYTGFALKFPDTWLFAWFVALEKGHAIRSWIHRGAAIVMVLACLWHLAYLPTRRGRSLLLHMLPRFQDVIETFQNLGYLLGLRAEPPRFDRFSYIEKAEYWALIWGSVVMAATGAVLWFENFALRFLAKWVLDMATLVHYYEAWLATLAIIVWHFYMVIFNPDVYPMNWTWLTGKVSEEMLRHEHPREYERLQERGEL
jgi:formate dehydrogenase gamma subunit